jgi:membrane-bound serine protease (ClpP class)
MGLVITLFVVGAILLLLETVLPGMIAGIIGLLCVIVGVVEAFIIFGPETGTYVLAGAVVALMFGTFLWLKFFPESRAGRVFASHQTVGEIGTERPELVGKAGIAFTPLRPSGTAVINGQRIDVVTEGSMVDRGVSIRVVAVEGMRVVVRAVSENSAPTTN